MRDFLHSEISQLESIPNLPSDLQLAIHTGKRLCEDLLEPLQNHFGSIAIRSPISLRRSMRLASARATNAPVTNETMRAISGMSGTNRDIAALWPASSSRGLPTAMPKARTGGRWCGGYMTICRTRSFAFIPGSARSTSAGMRSRNGSSAATSRRKGCYFVPVFAFASDMRSSAAPAEAKSASSKADFATGCTENCHLLPTCAVRTLPLDVICM